MLTAVETERNKLLGGKYRLVAPLGQGAMGVVYRAEQLDVEGHVLREVALKTLRPELARDSDFSRRFLREVRVAARLRNPHTVTVYDSGLDSAGELFYTMEMVEGKTLKDILRSNGPLPVPRMVKIVGQICEALAEAHSLPEPIVHRDIKPANIFIEERQDGDWVKVGDFGIAKVLGEETSGLSHAGSSPGTPRYMAPEQWMGKEVDGRADLYALGVMVYELLTGGPPFSPAEGAMALMYQHLQDPPRPLPSSIPPGIRRQIEQLLAKAPADRPANALLVRQALEQALLGEDGQRTIILPIDPQETEQTVLANVDHGITASSPSTTAIESGSSSEERVNSLRSARSLPEEKAARVYPRLVLAASLLLVTVLGSGLWYQQSASSSGQQALQTNNNTQRATPQGGGLPQRVKAAPMQETNLIVAARTGSEEAIRAALAGGTDVNARGVDGRTALMWAAERGETESVQLLLDNGADVNLTDNEGRNAFLRIASRPYEKFGLTQALTDTAELLLARGADITIRDAEGKTALLWAIQNEYDSIARALLSRNVPTDIQDKDGNTVLLIAARRHQVGLMRLLLAKGATVDLRNAEGKTALMIAAEAGYVDSVRLLLENKADANLRDNEGKTALIWATNSGATAVVQALLEKGADPTLVTKGGRNALMIAAIREQVDILQLLFSKGVDINATDGGGRTALMWAVHEVQLESVRTLLAKGASVNVTDNDGRSALILAAAKEYLDAEVEQELTAIVQELLAKNANITFRSGKEGRTALLWAADKGHVGIVRALLTHKADTQVKDLTGKTALLLANDKKHAEVIDLLTSAPPMK